MDPKLLDYYHRELVYMREKSAEFAQQHPKIAKRLGLQGMEVADPYVERLIEAFCFMTARTQIKMDAEFPRFTQRLLEVMYPNYLCPTPAMSVAHFAPDHQQGDLKKGFVIPRHTVLRSSIPHGQKTACTFRSSQDVTLWPIEITHASLTEVPQDMVALCQPLAHHKTAQSALQLTFRTKGDYRFSDLVGLDCLPIYLAGETTLASQLLAYLHTATLATVVRSTQDHHVDHVVYEQAITHPGLQAEQSLLPLSWNTHHGNNLLHTFFACPEVFYFFSLNQLACALTTAHTQEITITILLSEAAPQLQAHIHAKQFALHCSPIINLYPGRTDRIPVNQSQTECHIVADRTRPLDVEIYAIEKIEAQLAESSETFTFLPLLQTVASDHGNHGQYFSVRRELRRQSDITRQYGPRTPYIGTESFVSLVDQHAAPYRPEIRYLMVNAYMTNRDLPLCLPYKGSDDLFSADAMPVAQIGMLRPPSQPLPPFAEGEHAWRLIQQLNANALSLTTMSPAQGAQALRDLLQLFVRQDHPTQQQLVRSIVATRFDPVTQRLPGDGPIMYGRGIACTITIDEVKLSGTSPYLLACILSQWLGRHASVNVFTQVTLQTLHDQRRYEWPAYMGQRSAV
jgi:type VI secretion system protein ImpG